MPVLYWEVIVWGGTPMLDGPRDANATELGGGGKPPLIGGGGSPLPPGGGGKIPRPAWLIGGGGKPLLN